MKRIMLVLVLIISTLSLYAETILNEGFESGIPSSWQVLDLDGHNGTAMGLEHSGSTHQAHNGNGSVQGGCSYNPDDPNEILTTNNWLITEQVSLNGDFTLDLWMLSFFEEADRLANVNILLSTSGNSPADFTENLASDLTIPYGYDNVTGYVYTQFSYDLSAYTGETVYIAIQNKWETNQNNFIMFGLDDLSISGVTLAYPEITITNPAENDLLSVRDILTLSVDATNTDFVKYYKNGEYLGLSEDAPFSFDWLPGAESTGQLFEFKAEAYNENGMKDVVVENIRFYDIRPKCNLTAPDQGFSWRETFIGELIEISANATDTLVVGAGSKVINKNSQKEIINVKFYIDGVFLSEDNSAPYEAVWDTEGTSVGEHRIKAIAEDNDGNLSYRSELAIIMMARVIDNDMVWSDIYGGFGVNGGFSVIELSDGKIINAGITRDEAFIIKYSAAGVVEWEKSYSESGGYSSAIMDIAETFDISGNSTGLIATGYAGAYLWLLKVDNDGVVEWTKKLGGVNEANRGNSIKQTADLGFIIAGYNDSHSNNYGAKDAWIIKTDALGVVEWDYLYGTEKNDSAEEIIISADNNYLFTGYKNRSSIFPGSSSEGDIILIKLDENGDEIFNRSYGGTADDVAVTILETFDNNIVLGGITSGDYNENKKGGYLLKLDAAGEIIFTKVYSNYADDTETTIKSIIEYGETGYLIGGYDNELEEEFDYDFWLKRVDNLGNHQWDKRYGGTNTEVIESICKTADDGLVFTGYTYTWGEWFTTIYNPHCSSFTAKVKYIPSAIEDDLETLISDYELKQNYPNPFNPATTIKFFNKNSGKVKMAIYNIKGELVEQLINRDMTAGNHSINFDGSSLNSGVYYYSLFINGEKVDTKSMVLIK